MRQPVSARPPGSQTEIKAIFLRVGFVLLTVVAEITITALKNKMAADIQSASHCLNSSPGDRECQL